MDENAPVMPARWAFGECEATACFLEKTVSLTFGDPRTPSDPSGERCRDNRWHDARLICQIGTMLAWE
jgi:hypothetical protein